MLKKEVKYCITSRTCGIFKTKPQQKEAKLIEAADRSVVSRGLQGWRKCGSKATKFQGEKNKIVAVVHLNQLERFGEISKASDMMKWPCSTLGHVSNLYLHIPRQHMQQIKNKRMTAGEEVAKAMGFSGL